MSQQPTTDNQQLQRFNRLCFSTLLTVYLVIAVGSIVRTTGSGMGCPDWPRCFGSFIPPTSISQLPPDYKERYAAVREKKNIKFAKYLRAFGFDDTADKILSDKSILVESDFNPVKTWIEYINRLVGVIVGFFIIALAWRSLEFRKTDPKIFWISIATLVGVIFQGWFGSIVVSTNLTTWTITVHMFLALIIVLLLVYLLHRTGQATPVPKEHKWLVVIALLTLFIQVYFGTEVRSAIDRISALLPRDEWIIASGSTFITHRTFAQIAMFVQAVLLVKIRKTQPQNPLSLPLLLLILGVFFSGLGMAYFAVPAVLQPLHLLMATMTIGTEALLLFRINGSN
jgi:heme a synthase